MKHSTPRFLRKPIPLWLIPLRLPHRGLHFGTSFVRIRDGHFFNARRHMYRASVVHFEDLLLILYKTQGPVIYPEGVLTCALFTDKKLSLFVACERNSEQLFTFPMAVMQNFGPVLGSLWCRCLIDFLHAVRAFNSEQNEANFSSISYFVFKQWGQNGQFSNF